MLSDLLLLVLMLAVFGIVGVRIYREQWGKK